MGPRWLFASSSPCSVKPIFATHCSCSYIRRSHHRRGSANWLNSPVASTLANIDRPPANKPKLSYVGSKISGARSLACEECIPIMRHASCTRCDLEFTLVLIIHPHGQIATAQLQRPMACVQTKHHGNQQQTAKSRRPLLLNWTRPSKLKAVNLYGA